jgi:excisionase family DNA binding protein
MFERLYHHQFGNNKNRKELAMTSSKPVRLLTPDEAAQFLSVSQRTVKRLVADGSLRAYKIRRSMRFRLEDLEADVEQNNWT